MRHLIDPMDLTVEETGQVIALAEKIIADRAGYSQACKGRRRVGPLDRKQSR